MLIIRCRYSLSSLYSLFQNNPGGGDTGNYVCTVQASRCSNFYLDFNNLLNWSSWWYPISKSVFCFWFLIIESVNICEFLSSQRILEVPWDGLVEVTGNQLFFKGQKKCSLAFCKILKTFEMHKSLARPWCSFLPGAQFSIVILY